MKIEALHLKGLIVLEPRVFHDNRGFFYESYNHSKFEEAIGHSIDFVQDNESVSHKYVLRGLHFQVPPKAQGKLVRVVKGSVLDVAVDIRKESPTYGQHVLIELSAENKKQFWIPPGFAHGFIALEDDTIFAYKCTDYYAPECESALLWNDTSLGIQWNCVNPLVSDKDKLASSFTSFNSPF